MNVGKITDCFNYGTITSPGGACGIGYAPTIQRCINHGDISGKENAGGISYVNNLGCVISDCINYGNITHEKHTSGNIYIGGISGLNLGTIENCANFGEINGTSGGGIAGETGWHYDVTYAVINCVYAGEINGSNGKIYSISLGNKYIQGCYTLYRSNPQDGTPLCTVAQLNDKSFWTNTLGWDESIWSFDGLDVENGKYPTLRKN